VIDSARAMQEAELTPEEVERILRVCGTRALLVGGQALAAVPVDRIGYPRFHEQQWPKVQERLAHKRAKFVALQAKRDKLLAKRKLPFSPRRRSPI
jgi:hypothetical protein